MPLSLERRQHEDFLRGGIMLHLWDVGRSVRQKTSDYCLELAFYVSQKGCIIDEIVDRRFSTAKWSAIRSFAMCAPSLLARTGIGSLLISWARCSVSGFNREKAAKREMSCCPLVSQGTTLTSSLHKDCSEDTKFLIFTCCWLKSLLSHAIFSGLGGMKFLSQ